jgi:cation diffusion facilitator family transporter
MAFESLHRDTVERLRSAHSHDFALATDAGNERRVKAVVVITLVAMVAEVAAGLAFGSMALLADGLHMATHAGALGIAAYAYAVARHRSSDPRFAFGTGKVGALGGFASAVLLAVVALWTAVESVRRLYAPVGVELEDALLVAFLGLIVNLASIALLGLGHDGAGQGHGHDHGHARAGHDQAHDHGAAHDHAAAPSHPHAQEERDHGLKHDRNLRAAFLHVAADALTSVLAIAALAAGLWLGWLWLDPAVGILGAALIGWWSWGMLRDCGRMLLDYDADAAMAGQITQRIEAEGDNRVADLHVWHVGPRHLGVILSVVTHAPQPPDHYKALLEGLPRLAHVTVEVHRCADGDCA